MERRTPAEGKHVLGDMVERAEKLGVDTPLLRLAQCHAGTNKAHRKHEARQFSPPGGSFARLACPCQPNAFRLGPQIDGGAIVVGASRSSMRANGMDQD